MLPSSMFMKMNSFHHIICHSKDWVKIYNGVSEDNRLLATLCGKYSDRGVYDHESGRTMRSVESIENIMFVRFQSNTENENRGYKMRVETGKVKSI